MTGIKIVCCNCNNSESIDGDVSNFQIVSYPNSAQVSIECSICGEIVDLWTWESTMNADEADEES